MIKFEYTPHDKQKEIHMSCADSSTNFWTIVCAGRQGGKSKCAKYQAILWALQNEGANVWYICPSEGQAKKVFREIYVECQVMGLIKSKIQSKGDIHIQFNNDSKIEFKSAASEDSLRGSSVTHLILDECAFIKQSTIEEVILPTMGVTGKKILCISTPKGKNYFYELFMRGLSGEDKFKDDYKSFKFSSKDNPKASIKLIESFRASLPSGVFQQEFEAEFVDSAAVFPFVYDCATMTAIRQAQPGQRYYMAADIALAAKGDYTVITIIDNLGRMVYMDRFRGLEAPELQGRIIHTYNLFKPLETWIEENNQGLPIIHNLKGKVPNLKGFRTTPDSKSQIINNLIAAFSSKEIQVLNDEIVKSELNAYIFKFTPSGHIKYEAASGFHDDIVMSLAICWEAYNSKRRGGGYHIYGGDNKPGEMKDKQASRLGTYLKSLDNNNLNEGGEYIFVRS